MNLKRLFILLLVALFSMGLVACELSASTPPPTVSGQGPMGTLQGVLGNIATQTAAAGGGVVVLPTTQPPPEQGGETTADTATPAPTAEPSGTPTEEPPTSTPVTVSSPTPGIPQTYTLHKGEHPFCIARRFDVNQYELLNINGLSLNSRPQVGFTLKIPQTGDEFAGERTLRAHPDTYTVQAGDTIYSIACLYGDVSPEAIIEANDLSGPNDLETGQKLQIPK